MNQLSSRERMQDAMSLGKPKQIPVMCQLSIGHQLLVTGADPVGYFLDTGTYVEVLLQLQRRYRFDGILLHKPGREPGLAERTRTLRDPDAPPRVVFEDGAEIRCRPDDDPMYLGAPGFALPEELADIDPEDPLGWAPASYRVWCRHKGSAPCRTPGEIPAYWLDAIHAVRGQASDVSIHGEVRSPLDHLFALVGMQNGLMALLTEPDRARALLDTLTDWSTTWAVAQVHAGCDAIKCSSPYAGAGFISRDQYLEWVVPFERRIADAVRAAGGIIYTHTCGAIGDRLDLMAETGVHGIEALDPPPLGTVDIREAKQVLKDKLFIKGNVNPVALRTQSVDEARTAIVDTLRVGREGGQYVLSTACSISPTTPPENVEQFAAMAAQSEDLP